LQQAIGDARVVLLGGVNDGAIVRARFRLVRFLHEEMGFDVLACGRPLFDAAEFDRALDVGKIPRPDLQELNEQAFDFYGERWGAPTRIGMLDYVRETHKRARPLHFAGLGLEVSAYAVTDYSRRLFQFLDRIDPQLASPADRKAIQALIELSGPRQGATGFFPRMVPVDSRQWEKKLDPGLAAAAKVYASLRDIPEDGPNVFDISFYRQTLLNLVYFASLSAGRDPLIPPPHLALTLAKVWRPQSKIIVWATNWGAGRDLALLDRPNGARATSRLFPGSELARAFGNDVYAVAFSEIKNDNGVLQVLQAGPQATLAPVDGDLESLLHAAGKPYSFIDFRSLPAHHWLRTPLSARFLYGADVTIWPDHFDGLVTIDAPASKARK
jgi:erythromycin esterase-like protein